MMRDAGFPRRSIPRMFYSLPKRNGRDGDESNAGGRCRLHADKTGNVVLGVETSGVSMAPSVLHLSPGPASTPSGPEASRKRRGNWAQPEVAGNGQELPGMALAGTALSGTERGIMVQPRGRHPQYRHVDWRYTVMGVYVHRKTMWGHGKWG